MTIHFECGLALRGRAPRHKVWADGTCRRVQRAPSAAELRVDESLPSGNEADAAHWDIEEFMLEEEGMVIFDGGSFSRGPFSLGTRVPPSKTVPVWCVTMSAQTCGRPPLCGLQAGQHLNNVWGCTLPTTKRMSRCRQLVAGPGGIMACGVIRQAGC